MLVYSFTYFVNAVGYYLNKKSAEQLKIIVVIMLILISGTRYYMGGNDVYVYEGVYNNVPSVGIVLRYMLTGVNLGVNENYETGFLLICSIFKACHLTYFGFTLVFSILFYVLMVTGLKEFVQSWSAFFALFMYKLMFYDTFISIRQGFTIAVFCISLKYLRDNKWIKYFVCCIIAFLIHRAALFLFLLYFVRYIPISRKMLAGTAIVFFPTLLIRSRVDLSGILQTVIDLTGFVNKSSGWTETSESISLIHTLELYIIIGVVWFFYDKIVASEHEKEATLALQLFLVAIPIFTLLSNWIVMTRVKDYIVLMYGVLFGFILEGGTTEILPVQTAEDDQQQMMAVPDMTGVRNYHLIVFVLTAACFIGMMRYVMAFDGGVLMEFKSFLFVQGAGIFEW